MSWGYDLRSLYDVSCLLGLFDTDHGSHDLVSAWFDTSLEEGWATCPLTQNGYLRIMSQPSYPRPVSTVQAYERLVTATQSPHHQFIADDISLLDENLVEFRSLSSHRQLTDVYLLALAVAHNARLVTLDTRISLAAVHGPTEDHLTVLLNPLTQPHTVAHQGAFFHSPY